MTATQTPAACKTFVLDGCTPGGIIEQIEFAPKGSVVVVTHRYPRMAPHSSEMPVQRARQYYAERVKLGYRRVA